MFVSVIIVSRTFECVKCFWRFFMFVFSEHLRYLRSSRKITQKQLANEIGSSERGIQNYELGSRKPTYDTLIALADYFDVSIDYLVGRSDNPKVNK